jgi:hypothetical protein
MTRPVEYEAMIQKNWFAVQAATPGAISAYLLNARSYLAAARQLDASTSAMPAFSLAYEGLFQVVQAVLEFYEVRTKDAGRNMAISRVCADLKMSAAEQAIVSKAHQRRNGTSYTSPFPPVSTSEALALAGILAKYIPVAYALVGLPYV